eukprot:3310483-Pyramimonas_sp.AAC.1
MQRRRFHCWRHHGRCYGSACRPKGHKRFLSCSLLQPRQPSTEQSGNSLTRVWDIWVTSFAGTMLTSRSQ